MMLLSSESLCDVEGWSSGKCFSKWDKLDYQTLRLRAKNLFQPSFIFQLFQISDLSVLFSVRQLGNRQLIYSLNQIICQHWKWSFKLPFFLWFYSRLRQSPLRFKVMSGRWPALLRWPRHPAQKTLLEPWRITWPRHTKRSLERWKLLNWKRMLKLK